MIDTNISDEEEKQSKKVNEREQKEQLEQKEQQQKEQLHNRIYLILGLLLAASELWKQYTLTFVLNGGAYQWSYIPFQLCSMPMYLCLFIGLSGRQGFMRQLRRACIVFLSDYTLMSGIVTFLDTSGLHYGYAPLTVHSYVWHMAIAAAGFYSGLILPEYQCGPAIKRKRSRRDFLQASVIFLAGCGIAELINLSLDRYGIVNMFYINPHYYVNQIVFNDLAHILPNNLVIVIYIICVMLAAFTVHACWMLYDRYKPGRKTVKGDF